LNNNNNNNDCPDDSFVAGNGAYTTYENSIALGSNAIPQGQESASILSGRSCYNSCSIGTGQFPSYTYAQDSISIGPGASAGQSVYTG
jgi:hypothetical protein